MKTLTTSFASFIFCCITLVFSCKEEGSPTGTKDQHTSNNFMMYNDHEYATYYTVQGVNPVNNRYGCAFLLHYQGDTIIAGIQFKDSNPSLGKHSFGLLPAQDAELMVESAKGEWKAASGHCVLSKENEKFTYQFTDIVLNENQPEEPFKVSGVLREQ